METPVPIPNTEVKHHNGDDSGHARQQQAAGSDLDILGYPFFMSYIENNNTTRNHNRILIVFYRMHHIHCNMKINHFTFVIFNIEKGIKKDC